MLKTLFLISIFIPFQNAQSIFQRNPSFITPVANSFGGYQLYSLDRLNINCSGLGLNSFQLGDSIFNKTTETFWYTVQCVYITPFATTSSTVLTNIQAVQGGITPVYNFIFFQYLTPYIADCSGMGGAITQLHFQSTNNYANAGFSYTCGTFDGLSLSRCRTVTNKATSVGYTSYSFGNANYLDSQSVTCAPNEALQTIKWTYNGDSVATGQYIYTCCQAPCPYNYYVSGDLCARCPAGRSSSGGSPLSCYPIQFNQQQQFQLPQENTGTWSLYYMDRLNLNCHGQGINCFKFDTTYGSSYTGSYTIQCAFPGFTAIVSTVASNIQAVQGGTVAVLNIKYLQFLTPYMADCR